ncbi:DUF7689 domain-containing protein [Aggregatibacter actinomycetemcomitans]|uniref:DUF7689 domain-containing protein n=1 Tax=Aggregatibacter actinomycetemcomitans TaxID=714 RepID=UPI00022AC809|nr:hypothetical protein [Aggregatibacter actinomycetemcomitans]
MKSRDIMYLSGLLENDCKNIPTFSRPLDESERIIYKGFFPNLNLSTAKATSISTECYNCVAWTLGITDDWLWPEFHAYTTDKDTTLEDFDKFYEKMGFVRAASDKEAHITAWGNTTPEGKLYMTHASVTYPDYQGQWESKLGKFIRMKHDPNDLQGNSYGRRVAYYKKSTTQDLLQTRLRLIKERRPVTYDEAIKLNRKLVMLPKALIDSFDNKYEFWKETWDDSSDVLATFSSNPTTFKLSNEYQELVKLGKNSDILPLVVLRLLFFKNDFFALQLYDELQANKSLVVEYDDNFHLLEGEKGRAHLTVKKYISSL